jgi:hypothetical protein
MRLLSVKKSYLSPSIEQAMDEEQTGSFQVRYFDDSEKATNRLLRQ